MTYHRTVVLISIQDTAGLSFLP